MQSAMMAIFSAVNYFLQYFLRILSDLFPSLMFLLPLFGPNNGQLPPCNFRQWVSPDQLYSVANMGYPRMYARGSSCRWILTSDRPIRFTCERFNVPFTPGCQQNKLIIQDGYNRPRYYCGGDHSFSLISESNQLIITLDTSQYSLGGAFSCAAVAMERQGPPPCICGRKNPARIYGGEETGVNEFPMMAALVSVQNYIPLCGGTIINEKQVLTAAHCVVGRKNNEIAILVGDHNLQTGEDTRAARLFRVDYFRPHELYNVRTSDYDIALITIEGVIFFNERVSPVCLPFQRRSDTFAGNSMLAVGWGALRAGEGPSDVLMKGILGVPTNQQCTPYYNYLTYRQMCTQEPGKDSCQFDSGGPLLWHSHTTGRLIQIGIVIAGSVCGVGDPALNTRIGPLLDWIEHNTPPNIEYCRLE